MLDKYNNIMSDLAKLIIGLIILSIVETIGVIFLKKYNRTRKIPIFVLGAIFYVIVAALLVYLFNFQKIAIVNSLWNGISIVLITISGYLFFKESLTSNEIIAIILIIIAGFLISNKN